MSAGRDDFTIAIRSALLQKGNRQKFSLLFLLCLSIVIFFLDTNPNKFSTGFRSIINDGVYRVSSLASSPHNFFHFISKKITLHVTTYEENKILKSELEKLKTKNLDIQFLKTQNKDLLRILNTNIEGNSKQIIGRVLLDKNSPYLKSIIINQGSKEGIVKGSPVLDGKYLVGRVVETNYLSSRVLLLNDLNSRIPVTIGEPNEVSDLSGAVQAILTGKGKDFPVLEYLPDTYIPKNKLPIFTSGKDGIFNQGIPIGLTEFNGDKIIVRLFSKPNQLSFVNLKIINKEKNKF